jgi:hypothetical protein
MVDGTFYFDEDTDRNRKEQIDSERNRIISNILKEPQITSMTNPKPPER